MLKVVSGWDGDHTKVATAPEKIAELAEIREPISGVLRPLGFREKTKRIWEREVESITQVVHLDKSTYGPQNRLDVLIGHNSLVGVKDYKILDFDTVVRFDRVVESREVWKRAMDQEDNSFLVGLRRSTIYEIASNQLIPIISIAVNLNGIRLLREQFPSMNDLFIGLRTTRLLEENRQF